MKWTQLNKDGLICEEMKILIQVVLHYIHGRELQVGGHCWSLGSVQLCVGGGLSGKKASRQQEKRQSSPERERS